jgi:hypothetical protein
MTFNHVSKVALMVPSYYCAKTRSCFCQLFNQLDTIFFFWLVAIHFLCCKETNLIAASCFHDPDAWLICIWCVLSLSHTIVAFVFLNVYFKVTLLYIICSVFFLLSLSYWPGKTVIQWFTFFFLIRLCKWLALWFYWKGNFFFPKVSCVNG